MTPQDTERDELRELIAKLYVDSHTAWPEARATEWPDVFAEKAETAIQQLYAKREREIVELKSHLAYMAGVYEGMTGEKNGYLIKNWPEYATITPDTAKEISHD